MKLLLLITLLAASFASAAEKPIDELVIADQGKTTATIVVAEQADQLSSEQALIFLLSEEVSTVSGSIKEEYGSFAKKLGSLRKEL